MSFSVNFRSFSLNTETLSELVTSIYDFLAKKIKSIWDGCLVAESRIISSLDGVDFKQILRDFKGKMVLTVKSKLGEKKFSSSKAFAIYGTESFFSNAADRARSELSSFKEFIALHDLDKESSGLIAEEINQRLLIDAIAIAQKDIVQDSGFQELFNIPQDAMSKVIIKSLDNSSNFTISLEIGSSNELVASTTFFTDLIFSNKDGEKVFVGKIAIECERNLRTKKLSVKTTTKIFPEYQNHLTEYKASIDEEVQTWNGVVA